MKHEEQPPIMVPARPAILLFFSSPTDQNSGWLKRPMLTLTTTLQRDVGPSIRIIKIDQFEHPEVVRSFEVRQLPAFVLVREGIELWRHEGVIDQDHVLRSVQAKLLIQATPSTD